MNQDNFISSHQNSLVKKVKKLGESARFRKKENLIILDGIHLLQEFLKQDLKKGHKIKDPTRAHAPLLKNILITEKFEQNPEFQNLTRGHAPLLSKISVIADHISEKISPTKTPSGIITVINKPQNPETKKDYNFILLLDGIQDPGNIGTILRTAKATGVQAVFGSPECVDFWSPKVLRSSMGGHFGLDIFDNFNLEFIKEIFSGNIYGTFMDGKNIFKEDFSEKTAFIMGNEGTGISPKLEKIIDKKISIPMENHVESLNVGTATTICCYEKYRQKF